MLLEQLWTREEYEENHMFHSRAEEWRSIPMADEFICPVCNQPVDPKSVGTVSHFERPATYLHPQCEQKQWEAEEAARINERLGKTKKN